jgi:plasmid maintenance system killer protein
MVFSRYWSTNYQPLKGEIMSAIGMAVNAKTLKSLIVQNRSEAAQAADALAPKRAVINEAIAALEKQFANENFNLLLQKTEAEEAAANYERQLREMAVQHFEETGEKRMDADCSVRVNVKYEYDNVTAVAWAETNAPVLIVKNIDKKSFESLPSTPDLPFVTKTESVSAVIAKEFTDV